MGMEEENTGLRPLQTVGDYIKQVKQCRVNLDEQLFALQLLQKSREASLAITKIEECIMWLGKELSRVGNPTPYPASMDPTSTDVEETADTFKR